MAPFTQAYDYLKAIYTALNGVISAGRVLVEATLDPTGLALESGGNLAAIKAKTDNLPSDPAKESGKLADLSTTAGSTSDAAVTSGAGSISAKLRGLVETVVARLPVIGPQLAAASLSVIPIDFTGGTSAFLAVSGTAATTIDLAAGRYKFKPTIDITYRINPSGDSTASVWATSPGRVMLAGEERIISLTANQRINAITTGGTGSLEYTPVS